MKKKVLALLMCSVMADQHLQDVVALLPANEAKCLSKTEEQDKGAESGDKKKIKIDGKEWLQPFSAI